MERRMSTASKHEVVEALAERYSAARRSEKSRILNEFVAVTGYHRKHAVRLLSSRSSSGGQSQVIPQQQGRRLYGEAVRGMLVVAWEAADRICGKRLRAALPFLIDAMERHGHVCLDRDAREQLLRMSAATIDRLLGSLRDEAGAASRRRRAAGTIVGRRIAIKTFADWKDAVPGHFEADFVAHCGGAMSGRFIHTLVLTDVATGWTDFVPLIAREQSLVVQALKILAIKVPMGLKGLDTDNDSAFINDTVFSYCETNSITFTRSRAYRKNDQAWVEQKNGAIVRRLVGYGRFEGVEQAHILARLYQSARAHVNFFQPSFKLKEKVRIGAKVRKTYFRPETPCDRVLSNPLVSEDVKLRLVEQRSHLDPVALLKSIREAQAELALIGERPDRSVEIVTQPGTLDHFLGQLPEMWKRGEVRPTHRKDPKGPRTWRTRIDPFEDVWAEILRWLEKEPDITAKMAFDRLQSKGESRFTSGQLRTLQRRIKEWRRVVAEHLISGSYDSALAVRPLHSFRG